MALPRNLGLVRLRTAANLVPWAAKLVEALNRYAYQVSTEVTAGTGSGDTRLLRTVLLMGS